MVRVGRIEVAYGSEVSSVGKVAMFGDRIMKAKAKDTEKEFTKNLAEKLRWLA
jgi:carbon monoxide dehydrogenase subunit G